MPAGYPFFTAWQERNMQPDLLSPAQTAHVARLLAAQSPLARSLTNHTQAVQ